MSPVTPRAPSQVRRARLRTAAGAIGEHGGVEHGGVEYGGVERLRTASCVFGPGELRVVVRDGGPGEQVPCVGVEGLTVVAQLCGGPGERLGDAAAEHLLQQRHHLAAEADAGETGVDVVRVVPEGQALRPARRRRVRAPQTEQRPQPGWVPGLHAGQRPGSRAAAEAEQHGLGLVIEGVAEQDGRVGVRAGDAQGAVPGAAGGRLGTAAAVHDHAVHRCRNALSGQIGDERGAAFGGALLQPVVDHRDVHPAGCDGPGRGEQGRRVGSAGAGDEQRRRAHRRGQRVERRAHRPTHGGDGPRLVGVPRLGRVRARDPGVDARHPPTVARARGVRPGPGLS